LEVLDLSSLTLDFRLGLLKLVLLHGLSLLLALELITNKGTSPEPDQAADTGTCPGMSRGTSDDSTQTCACCCSNDSPFLSCR
jgi:hypothetical protein